MDTVTEINPLIEVVTINGLEVTVTATLQQHAQPPMIAYTATCGQSKPVHFSASFHPNLQRVAAHVDKEHRDAVMKVATDPAAHEHARLLLLDKFSGGS